MPPEASSLNDDDEIGPLRAGSPALLLVGDGWFPNQPGGLNRYLRGFHQAWAGRTPIRSVVVGPATDILPGTVVVAQKDDALPWRLARSFAEIRRDVRGVDIVDSHFALYAWLPVATRMLGKRPLVAHFHGPWADESSVAGQTSVIRLKAKRSIERTVYRHANALVVLSHAYAKLVVEEYGASPERVHVIPPGVDLGAFAPGDRAEARRRLGLGAETWVVVTVRRLVPRMGVDVLLRAWSRLGDEAADRQLLIVGDGPSRRALELEVARLGIEDTVRFCGRLDDDRLKLSYQAADVCVLPSVALEGYGLVVLEALACGAPVIGTDVGGLPEALAPLDPSLVVPAGDADALAERLRASLGSGALPSAAACRIHAEKFSWDVVVERHLDLYRRLLASCTAGPPQ